MARWTQDDGALDSETQRRHEEQEILDEERSARRRRIIEADGSHWAAHPEMRCPGVASCPFEAGHKLQREPE